MVTWEEQRTSTNSIVANNIARPKPEGRLVADVHKGKRKVQCCTTHSFRTWNVASMNQGKMKIIKE